jgi:hypothetical protein
MGGIIGGIATTKGFPIPYYYDKYITPGVDVYNPIIMYLDIALIYTIMTLIVSKIVKNKF